MTSYPIYMISHILLSWQHNIYTWHLTHCIWHHSHCICVMTQMTHRSVSMYCCITLITTSMEIITFDHVWLHADSTSYHIHTLWHQLSVFMTSEPLHSWHQISSVWHHIQGLWHLLPYSCDITATISVTSPPLWLWIHFHYIWHQTHCVKTIQPLYMTSLPPYLYLCDHTHWVDDITHTVCRTSHIMYVWHYMH